MANISFKEIKKIYSNGVTAVQDFNLDIEDKEFVVFVGPSGCGKSTALRLVAGLEDITEGSLFIDDEFCNDVEPVDRDTGMIFQNYALYPNMTVYDNMAHGLKIKKISNEDIDNRVLRAANILKIADILDRKPDEISGGQKQRVAMGRALVRQPKVLLMDEPLSNLDAKQRQEMRQELAKAHKELDATIIYVTHDQSEAMALGDRLVVMKDGIIQQVDTPLNIYLNPKNKFVAGFMGTPSMNFIEAVVIEAKNGIALQFGDYIMELPKAKETLLRDCGYINKEVIMGIRPEDIHAAQIFIATSPNSVVKLKVDGSELWGSDAFVYGDIGDCELVARVDRRVIAEEGEVLPLAFDLNKVYFFDKNTEERLFV